jgi:hypothetical protein
MASTEDAVPVVTTYRDVVTRRRGRDWDVRIARGTHVVESRGHRTGRVRADGVGPLHAVARCTQRVLSCLDADAHPHARVQIRVRRVVALSLFARSRTL